MRIKRIGAKVTSFILSLLLILSMLQPGLITLAQAETTEKVYDIIEITDFHGTLQDSSNNKVAAVLGDRIKKVKQSNPDRFIFLSGGDLYQGSPVSNVLLGKPVKEFLNNVGLDVTALGNHEFDWGLDKIVNMHKEEPVAKYDFVCSNLYDKTTGKRVFEPYKILEKDGLKIAVVGAISTETPTIVLPKNVENFEFKDEVAEINAVVKDIRDNNKADVVLALIHEGSDKTGKTGKIFDITNKLEGVDAVFGGHSHTIVYTQAENGIPVYIANSSGKGYIHVKMTVKDGKPSFTGSYIALDNASGYKTAEPVYDAEVQAIVDKAYQDLKPIFDVKIGYTDKNLTRTQKQSPYGESYLGNWVTDVMRKKLNADVAFQNNGGIRIDIPAGDITVGTIFYLMPFDNTLVKLEMTKAQLKAVLEQAFMDAGKGIQVSGLKVKYDPTRPSGDRVVDIIRENGKTISDTEKLVVVTNDFMATGGDGFTAFVGAGGADPKNNTFILVRDALIDAVKETGKVETTMNNRITNLKKSISIVATSDVHGNVLNFDYATGKPPVDSKGVEIGQGLAKVSTFVKNLRAQNPNVMLIDNGDTIQGTPLVYYYNMIDKTAEYPMMKVMGAMGYDAWVLGNHEYNYGLDTLNRVIKDAEKNNINVLSANTYKENGENFVKPYIIKSFNVDGKEVKVAVIGLTTKTIPSWESPQNYKGLEFKDLVEEAKKWVKEVKDKGADVVIVSAHSGEEKQTDIIPENQIKAIAQNVSGIDAIVAGHAHSLITENAYKNPEGKNVIVTEPGKWAQYISQIDIYVNQDGTYSVSAKNVKMDSTIEEDIEIVNLIKPYQDKTIEYIKTVVGKATGEFTGLNQTIEPTAIMELINKVQMEAAGTQLSIAAPLSSKAYIPQGDVTIQDIMSVYVYENFLYGIKMTGKQLKDWLEWSARYYKQVQSPTDKIEKDPVLNIPDYNLDQLYGATYDIDLTQPVGNRIKNLRYKGKLIKDTDVFTVAINNYRYNGGGGFMAAAGISNTDPSIVVYDSQKALGDDGQVRSLMIEYFKKYGTIANTVEKNWKLSTTKVEEIKDTEDTTNDEIQNDDKTTDDKEATNNEGAEQNKDGKLPKTGSVVDITTLFGAGAASIMIGAAFVIHDSRRKKKVA
ncbi:5'-nucleotidase C-terminal domain-containing protein [Caloramator sp. ALD01]|uniref:5'-nucleotidase C-terminal domain-containing protein n=1 Tax=Caloramator sp. ALD01 TaxID=1031288 RepID=UPI000426D67A|nr:5'-nucleotidase C-terminal domain-containing protein [Caloramator sp. ALD01]